MYMQGLALDKGGLRRCRSATVSETEVKPTHHRLHFREHLGVRLQESASCMPSPTHLLVLVDLGLLLGVDDLFGRFAVRPRRLDLRYDHDLSRQ